MGTLYDMAGYSHEAVVRQHVHCGLCNGITVQSSIASRHSKVNEQCFD